MASYLPKPGEVVRVVKTLENVYVQRFHSTSVARRLGAPISVPVYPSLQVGTVAQVREARRSWKLPLLSNAPWFVEEFLQAWWFLTRTGPVHVSFAVPANRFYLTPYTPCWVTPATPEEEAVWRLSNG